MGFNTPMQEGSPQKTTSGCLRVQQTIPLQYSVRRRRFRESRSFDHPTYLALVMSWRQEVFFIYHVSTASIILNAFLQTDRREESKLQPPMR